MTKTLSRIMRDRSPLFEVGVNIYDIGDWPEDVWVTLKEFCKLWGFSPPAFRKNKSVKGSRSALWLMGLREMNEAAAEFRVDDLLLEYRREFEDYMRAHNGLAPRTVESPRSLVGAIASTAARRRVTGDKRNRIERKIALLRGNDDERRKRDEESFARFKERSLRWKNGE
jgi:hypothetical protein